MNQNALEAKKAAVAEIVDGLKTCKTMAIVGYQGLSVAELNELRRTLAGKGSRMGIYKNTLAHRALKEVGIDGLDEYLEGPNAFVFSDEVSAGVNALYKFSRFHEHLTLRAGLVEGKLVDAQGLKEVAKLPSKEVLLSMFCMVLNEPMASLARAIDAIATKDAGTAPAAN